MKAIVHQQYGAPDLLGFEDVATPVPGDDEVLVRIRAASVNPLDWHTVRGLPYPLRIGNGFAGGPPSIHPYGLRMSMTR